MQDLFSDLTQHALARLRGSEVLLINFAGENSDFVRFNGARVRQAMTVVQAYLSLTLIDGGRRATMKLALTRDAAADRETVAAALAALREELPALPQDPYLLYATDVQSSQRRSDGRLPQAETALPALLAAADGADMVGVLASGRIARGFANSLGQRNWHEVDCFHFDWSVHHAADKAVKASYAGQHWDDAEVVRRLAQTREMLGYLAAPAKTVPPGDYRAYLAPAAVDELLSMINWGGVSEKAQRTQSSPLQRLVAGEAFLSAQVFLRENIAEGLAPAFDEAGFVKPPVVELIRAGRHAGALVSPRTARQYGIATNGANDEETMTAAELSGGSLLQAQALAALDAGVFIGNLWYLNYSDRVNGRITGMTRFATFWVEGGRIVAPLSVMRFDDSIYRMFGENLLALTREREWILSADTYGQRSLQTSRVPGALLSGLTFTL